MVRKTLTTYTTPMPCRLGDPTPPARFSRQRDDGHGRCLGGTGRGMDLEHTPIAVRVVAVTGIAMGIGFAVVGPWLLAAMAL